MPALIAQSSIGNRLLTLLSKVDFALLAPNLEPIQLGLYAVVVAANAPIQHAYFLDSGIVSVVASRSDGRSIEVGIYGRDGWGGFPLLLGSEQSPHDQYIQRPGSGYRINTPDFLRAIEQSPSINTLLLRFVHVFTTQTAQTALANGGSPVDERLARWLLMCHDRIDGDVLPLTHKFIGMMLGIRRQGVTDTIHIFEERGLIRAERGKITIRDRGQLEHLAGPSYGLAEAEYKRLIGQF
jgi:CRP-like cAMP-binding protein